MKSKKKSKKIVQKTNIKINIGNNPKPARRRRRAPRKPTPPQRPYYQLPMYAVQLGGNQAVNPGVSKDDLANIIQESNQLNSRKFNDLLTDRENEISAKIARIEHMKTPDFKIPKEYLKLTDLERFYSAFESGLPLMIKDIVKSEMPEKRLKDLVPSDETKTELPPAEPLPSAAAEEPAAAAASESKDEEGEGEPTRFTPLVEDSLVKEFFRKSKEKIATPKKKRAKKESTMNRVEAAANARAKKAEYAEARRKAAEEAGKEESEIIV